MSVKRSIGKNQYRAICILIFILVVYLFFDILSVFDQSNIECIIDNNENNEIEEAKNKTIHDNFTDLQIVLSLPRNGEVLKPFEYVIIKDVFKINNPSFATLKRKKISEKAANLKKFQWAISKHGIYKKDDPIVPKLLHDLATFPIIGVEEKDGGTEIKLTLEFPEDTWGHFKPMRWPRNHSTFENHFHFQDFERHHSEIAAFHLDRLLEFHRVIPVVGRVLDMKTEISDLCDKKLNLTFFISPANNTCFFGHCMIYCDLFNPVCGSPDKIEGSIAAYLPQFPVGKRKSWQNPWKRSYSPRSKAKWENDPDYCEEVRISKEYRDGRALLDVMDLGIFDFLMGNADRHDYHTFKVFKNESTPVIYDNGRGFGRPFNDDYLILAPLTQCCLIRETTLKTLLKFHNGPKKLSQAMNESLKEDPLEALLWDPHLIALDRRVEIILAEVRKCISKDIEKLRPQLVSHTLSVTSKSSN